MQRKQEGFSLIELLIVVAIILIIAAIAIPNILRSKMIATEASAVGSLRALNTACIAYATTYGSYPAALANLGPGSPATSTSADLIDSVLSSGTKRDRKSTRLNSSHGYISYAVFCLKKKKKITNRHNAAVRILT